MKALLRTPLSVFILSFTVLFAGQAHVAQAEPQPDAVAIQKIVADLHDSYERISDIQTTFVQTVEIMDFNTPYVSEGKLFIKKGKMLWDYESPGKQMIFVDGKGYQYYVPDHKQVIRSQIGGESDAHLPLKLLSGIGQLDEDFDVSFEIEAPKPGETIRLKLKPKKAMGVINIVLTLVPAMEIKGLVIDEVILYEQNGNISTSTFNDVQINKGVKDSVFDFVVPEGIEIINAP